MFNDIYKEIESTINSRTVPVASQQSTNVQGFIVSMPGTERLVLATTLADFVVCDAIGSGPKPKKRYMIVHKDQQAVYNGQYVDSNGYPVSIIPKKVFDAVTVILNNMNKQLQDTKRKLDQTTVEKEACMMTLNALRKNGVID